MSDNVSKPPLYPDEWYFSEGKPETGQSVGIRCFSCPDYNKFSMALLADHSLFRRLLLSLRDFSQASSALTFILEDVDFEKTYPLADLRRFQAYETSLVVSYCRPFSEAVGEVPRLSFGRLGIKLSPYTRRIHDELLNRRNKIFAHSDAGAIEFTKPVIQKMQRSDGSEFTTVFPPRFDEGLSFGYEEVRRIECLILSTIGAVMQLMQAMHPNFEDHYEVRFL